MKKTLLYLFISLIPTIILSQEKVLDNAYLKCQYKHSYLKDTLGVATYDDLFILQIGKNISKCFSYYTFQADSLSKTPNGDKVWNEIFTRSLEDFKKHRDRSRWMNSFVRTRSQTYIYKNYPQGKTTVADVVGSEHVIYEDSLNAQYWQIIDSTKKVLGYTCQKAECDFRGRRWAAWFAPDVPVNDGPWKLGGLPGLIMEAYDRGKQYHFIIVGLEQVADEPIVFSEPDKMKGKFTPINRKDFLKTQMNRLINSATFMEAETGFSFGNNKPVYRDLIERDYR